MSFSESSSNSHSNLEIEKSLTEVQQSLNELDTRYRQIKQDWQRKVELMAEKKVLEQKKANNSEKEPIGTQLNHLRQELETLELNLESILLPDLFWQVVRFVGIGIILGWFLKTIAG